MADGDSNVERYTLELATVGQDAAVANVNKVNEALTVTLAETRELTAASASLGQVFLGADGSALKLSDDLLALNPQLAGIGVATVGVDNVTTSLDAADASAQNLIRDIGDLGKDIQSIPEPDLSAFGVDDDGGGGGIGLGGARRGLRAAGMLLGSDAGGGALRGASSGLVLGASFGPAGIAVAALALGLRAVTEAADKASKAVTESADAFYKVQVDASSQTRYQLEQQRNRAQQTVDAQQKAYDEATQKFTDYVTSHPLLAFTPELHGLDTSFTGLSQAAIDQKTALDQDKAALDAANAALKLNVTLNSDEYEGIQREIKAQDMTKEQRDERIAQIQRELAIDDAHIEKNDVSIDTQQVLLTEIDHLNTELQQLTGISHTYADDLEEEARLKSVNTSYLDELAAEGATRDKIAALLQDEQDIRDDANNKAIQAQEDFHDADDASTEKANEKAKQLAEDNADKLAKIAQDNADRVAKIERDFARDFQTAVGERDAYAAQKAQQKHDDDLSDQQKANQEALDDQAKAYQKQQEQLTKALDDEYKAHYIAYQKQLANIQENEDKQIAAKEKALQQQYVDLQNEQAAELALTQNHTIGILNATDSLLQGVESVFVTYAQSIKNGVAAILGLDTPYPQLPTPLIPVIETPGGSDTPFPTSGGGHVYGAARQIVIHVNPTDGSAATNNFLRALDKMLPDNYQGDLSS